MMRKNNNNNNNKNMKHRGGGHRRYNNNGGSNNRGPNDGQNLSRQKHHATQMREKYFNLARDAQSNGERVDMEYYLQHVDHYVRVLADITAIEAERFAHQREQHAAQAGENEHATDAPEVIAEGQSDTHAPEANEEMLAGGNQPRMTRGPRRQHSPRGNAGAEAHAAPAPSVSKEIPLPTSMLTEIQA
jgi:hypothetical protein